jgi:hypothetical protein
MRQVSVDVNDLTTTRDGREKSCSYLKKPVQGKKFTAAASHGLTERMANGQSH